MIKAELVFIDPETKCIRERISNLIGIDEDLVVYSNKKGTIYFALTENLRVIADGYDIEDAQEIFYLLRTPEDVQICFEGEVIFQDAGWRKEMIERMVSAVPTNKVDPN